VQAKELGGLGYTLAYMGAFTGVRRNEALGLRFNDIEWFGNEVNVRHAISKRRGTDGAHKWEWQGRRSHGNRYAASLRRKA
jgi:integrase